MTHASLFSGIGAAELAAVWMGWKNLFHCEVDGFCNKILDYWFNDSIAYGDIRKTLVQHDSGFWELIRKPSPSAKKI